MARSTWTTKFIHLIARHIVAGKTIDEISAIFGMTPDALRVGIRKFKKEVDAAKRIIIKKSEPAETVVEEQVPTQEERELVFPELFEDIDLDTEYVTSINKFEVRIYRNNGFGPCPIFGEYKSSLGWHHADWFPNGRYNEDEHHPLDLIKKPVKTPIEIWVWCDGYGEHESFSSYEKAVNWQHVKGGKIIQVSI